MEEFEELLKTSLHHQKTADHILYGAYPNAKDPKLLLAVLDHVFLALTKGMSSLLMYERMFKRTPAYENSFDGKLRAFKGVAERYAFSKQHVQLFLDVKDLVLAHKKSPVEFTREEKYIICSERYHMQSLTPDLLKQHVQLSETIVQKIQGIVIS